VEQPERPHVVVVGGGFGGLSAARALDGAPVRMTLIDQHNYHLFQPLLYQVATAALSPGDIAAPIRAVLRRQENARVLLACVTTIDTTARRVHLEDGGEVAYDYLVVATGARHAYFGHDDWEQHAPGLKGLEDALEIRRRILGAYELAESEALAAQAAGTAPDTARQRALLTFVIVGGGPTGVELAGAIGEISRHTLAREFRAIDPRQTRIILVQGGPRILDDYPPALSERAAAALRGLGVEVWTGRRVTQVLPEGVQVGDESLAAQTILWAAGVAPSPLARTLGVPLERHGQVPVEPDLTVPGHPELYVVGDLASFKDPAGRQLPGIAPVAIQQGKWAARNILRTVEGMPRARFRYRDKGSLAIIGRGQGVGVIAGVQLHGLPAWFGWLFVHIYFLIGFANRLLVLTQWAWSYLTFQRSARLITGPTRRR
jgi:NADH dehydrogenase